MPPNNSASLGAKLGAIRRGLLWTGVDADGQGGNVQPIWPHGARHLDGPRMVDQNNESWARGVTVSTLGATGSSRAAVSVSSSAGAHRRIRALASAKARV